MLSPGVPPLPSGDRIQAMPPSFLPPWRPQTHHSKLGWTSVPPMGQDWPRLGQDGPTRHTQSAKAQSNTHTHTRHLSTPTPEYSWVHELASQLSVSLV